MKHAKDHYRAIQIDGYRWGGFDSENGLHMFSRKVLQSWQEVPGEPGVSRLVRDDARGSWHGLWENVLTTEQDLEDGNAEWMIKNGYKRSTPDLRVSWPPRGREDQ